VGYKFCLTCVFTSSRLKGEDAIESGASLAARLAWLDAQLVGDGGYHVPSPLPLVAAGGAFSSGDEAGRH
jgi:hypothetical protein